MRVSYATTDTGMHARAPERVSSVRSYELAGLEEDRTSDACGWVSKISVQPAEQPAHPTLGIQPTAPTVRPSWVVARGCQQGRVLCL